MPPKKEAAKGGASGDVEGEDPAVVISGYQKFCKSVGIPVNAGVAKCLSDEEKMPITQILIDDECGPLGPGGTRALMTAVMKPPYKLLTSLRFWRTQIGDDGASSVAELLRLGGAEIRLSYLEILDDSIGPRGCNSLGISLSMGKNLSLLTLKLDYNRGIGTQGAVNLLRGLRTNVTLKQLHLCYCNIEKEAGEAFGDLLLNQKSSLVECNLGGNRIGGLGLMNICKGLSINTTLEKLSLSDNQIDQTEEDISGLIALKEVLIGDSSALTSVNLLYNLIGEAGAKELVPVAEENKKLQELLIDASVPLELFEKIYRAGGGGKGKKGKKGKKK
jgi:hypothetical protein